MCKLCHFGWSLFHQSVFLLKLAGYHCQLIILCKQQKKTFKAPSLSLPHDLLVVVVVVVVFRRHAGEYSDGRTDRQTDPHSSPNNRSPTINHKMVRKNDHTITAWNLVIPRSALGRVFWAGQQEAIGAAGVELVRLTDRDVVSN